MQAEDLEAIEKARHAIDEVVERRYLGAALPTASLAATDFGELAPTLRVEEQRMRQEVEQGDRLRAGTYMSLSAAGVALEVCQGLVARFADMTPEQRGKAFAKAAEEAQTAADALRHASAIFAGEESPETEVFFEASRF